MTQAARQHKGDATVLGEVELLRKLLGVVVFSSVNGHAQAPAIIRVDGPVRSRPEIPVTLDT